MCNRSAQSLLVCLVTGDVYVQCGAGFRQRRRVRGAVAWTFCERACGARFTPRRVCGSRSLGLAVRGSRLPRPGPSAGEGSWGARSGLGFDARSLQSTARLCLQTGGSWHVGATPICLA